VPGVRQEEWECTCGVLSPCTTSECDICGAERASVEANTEAPEVASSSTGPYLVGEKRPREASADDRYRGREVVSGGAMIDASKSSSSAVANWLDVHDGEEADDELNEYFATSSSSAAGASTGVPLNCGEENFREDGKGVCGDIGVKKRAEFSASGSGVSMNIHSGRALSQSCDSKRPYGGMHCQIDSRQPHAPFTREARTEEYVNEVFVEGAPAFSFGDIAQDSDSSSESSGE